MLHRGSYHYKGLVVEIKLKKKKRQRRDNMNISYEFQRGDPDWPRILVPNSGRERKGTDIYLLESTHHPCKVTPLNRWRRLSSKRFHCWYKVKTGLKPRLIKSQCQNPSSSVSGWLWGAQLTRITQLPGSWYYILYRHIQLWFLRFVLRKWEI